MSEYKDKDIVSLNVNFRDLIPSIDDITQDELRLVTSDALKDNLTSDELKGLQKRFKKINYTILDMDQNRKGFGLTEDAMRTFVDHFKSTKEDKDLHNLFKDHDYGKIDSMIGRIIDTEYDEKNKRVRRTALIDLRTDIGKRIDMFQNLSTTLLHGKPVCSECGSQWMSCDHTNSFPRSTVAYGIEDSFVTQSAYPNAKKDSLGMFKSSLSSIDIANEYFDIDALASMEILEDPEVNKIIEEETEKSKIEEKIKQQNIEMRKQKEAEDIKNIKETIGFLKNIIEKKTSKI